MDNFEAVIASPATATMEDEFQTVSSKEEGAYDDDTPTSLAVEDESFRMENIWWQTSQIVSMKVKSMKKLTIVRKELLTCLQRLSQQQTIANIREDIGTDRQEKIPSTQTRHVF